MGLPVKPSTLDESRKDGVKYPAWPVKLRLCCGNVGNAK